MGGPTSGRRSGIGNEQKARENLVWLRTAGGLPGSGEPAH